MTLATGALPVTVDQNRCLNQRIRKENCQKCQAVCPKQSVSVALSNRDIPVTVADSCTGCGLCAAACPADAITVLRKPHKLELKSGKIEIMCSKQQLDSAFDCLGMLDAYGLAYIGMKAEQVLVSLNNDRCEQCNSGVVTAVKQNIQMANIVLRKLGKQDIQLVLRHSQVDIAIKRRELFAFCFSRARDTLLEMLPIFLNQEKPYRELLVDSVAERAEQCAKLDLSPLFWGSKVNDTCDLCGSCVRSCQNAALSITSKQTGRQRQLLHNQSKCIGCMACTVLCPQGALQVTSELSDIRVIASKRPVILTSKKCCNRCGRVLPEGKLLECEQCSQASTPYLQSIY